MAELRWGSGTHPGQIRAQNEDAVLADDGVFVVADGMGGHEAGEVASSLTVDRVRNALRPEPDDESPGDTDDDATAPPAQRLTAEQVVAAISEANGDIFRAAVANPAQAGMGTTVTLIAVIEDPMAGRGAPNIDENDAIDVDADGHPRVTPVVPLEKPEALVLANVGDSRTYLFRHDRLRRITVDHNYVQELVATGHITDAEARTHPRRNIITRALGIEPDVVVDWWTLPLVRGDRFLLCSDGLVDEVDDDDIAETLRSYEDPQAATDRLIELALEAGGRDNVTVVVVDVLDGDDPPDPTAELDVVLDWDSPPVDDGTEPAGDEPRDDGNPALAGLVAASDESSGAPDVASADVDERRPRRRRLRFILFAVAAALVVAAGVTGAAWARRGYFVDVGDGDRVTVYQGRSGGVLWIEPTVAARGPEVDELTDDALTSVEANPRFGSISDARDFVVSLERADADTDDAAADNADAADDAGLPSERPDRSATTDDTAPTGTAGDAGSSGSGATTVP